MTGIALAVCWVASLVLAFVLGVIVGRRGHNGNSGRGDEAAQESGRRVAL